MRTGVEEPHEFGVEHPSVGRELRQIVIAAEIYLTENRAGVAYAHVPGLKPQTRHRLRSLEAKRLCSSPLGQRRALDNPTGVRVGVELPPFQPDALSGTQNTPCLHVQGSNKIATPGIVRNVTSNGDLPKGAQEFRPAVA